MLPNGFVGGFAIFLCFYPDSPFIKDIMSSIVYQSEQLHVNKKQNN